MKVTCCPTSDGFWLEERATEVTAGSTAKADIKLGKTRNIADVPAYVTGPASLACGSCHRAALINEDSAEGLALFNRHIAQYGYMVEAGEDASSTLNDVMSKIMAFFK